MDLICRAVEKIVFSNVNGTILIPVIIALIPFFVGQAKDCIRVVKQVLREEREVTSKWNRSE